MTLELTVTLARTEFLAGEAMPLEVTLTNRGDAPAQVPDPRSPNAFDFGLTDAITRAPRYALSAANAHIARFDDPRRLPSAEVPLAPGASQSYACDLADYATTPISPGRYALTVRWYHGGDVTQAARPTLLAVVCARAARLAAHMSEAWPQLSAFMVHVGRAGATLYQRVSQRDAPADGVWYACGDLPPASTLSVATAVDQSNNTTGLRWHAWLQDDALGAVLCEGPHVLLRAAPLPLGLHAPTLFLWGWQPLEHVASFLLGGTGPDGATVLAWVTLGADTPPSVVTFSLGPVARPDHWCARALRGPSGLAVDLVMAWHQGGGTTLARTTLRPDLGTLDPVVTIASYPDRLAALQMNPAAREDVPVVDALFGPGGDGGMLLTRIASDGSATLAAWPLAAPRDQVGNTPTTWALGPTTLADPVVMTFFDAQALARRASDATWSDAGKVSPAAAHLHVFERRHAPWALWWDEAPGVVIKALFVREDEEPIEDEDEDDDGA